MKRCSKCKEWKNQTAFSIRRSCKDGLSCWCKKCECENARKYYRRKRKHVREYTIYEQCHRVVNRVKQKRCARCNKWKPESKFYKNRQHKDGLAYWCKECADEATNKARKRRLAARN